MLLTGSPFWGRTKLRFAEDHLMAVYSIRLDAITMARLALMHRKDANSAAGIIKAALSAYLSSSRNAPSITSSSEAMVILESMLPRYLRVDEPVSSLDDQPDSIESEAEALLKRMGINDEEY
jgi:hypothetical protein